MFEGTFLVDTNSYVRIARSESCVLGDYGGLELRLIKEIAAECGRSSRLKSITPWILQPPHPEHRAQWTLNLTRAERTSIAKERELLSDAVEDSLEFFAAKKKAYGATGAVLSGPDKALFFTAYALGCGIVTDEAPLSAVCKEFEVAHYRTLDLLNHFSKKNILTRLHIERMVKLWQYEKDEPKNWKTEYLKHFGPPIPLFQLDGG